MSLGRGPRRGCQPPEGVDVAYPLGSSATPELLEFLGKRGIPWEFFKTARKPISEAHNRQETPLFAKSIERHALSDK